MFHVRQKRGGGGTLQLAWNFDWRLNNLEKIFSERTKRLSSKDPDLIQDIFSFISRLFL
jgi:hypothetical protein